MTLDYGITDCDTHCYEPRDAFTRFLPKDVLEHFDAVGVYLQVRHNFVTNFFGSSKQIAEHTVMRLEPQPLINCGS